VRPVIGLKRTREPAFLIGPRVDQALAAARKFFGTETQGARQRKYDFDQQGLLEHLELTEALEAMAGNRCAFCNRSGATDATELTTHRLRPPQDAVASDGGTSRRHYWWLAYDWRNLYPACGACRIAQGAKFPTARARVRVGTTDELAAREEPLLLDPCLDDPEGVFVYLDSGEVVSGDDRGKATIETFDLNRPELIDERRVAAQMAMTEVREVGRLLDDSRLADVAEALDHLYSPWPPFAAVRRQFVNQWVQFRWRKVERALLVATDGELRLESLVESLRRVTGRVREETAVEFFGSGIREADISPPLLEPSRTRARPIERRAMKAPPPEEVLPYLAAAEIRSIQIRNFRAIESLDLQVARGPSEGSWLMLLGENGAGKTSVLQAIALTLCDPMTRHRLDLDGRKLVRRGASEGLVRVELTGSRRTCELHFGEGSRHLESFGGREGTLIAGYGATRLLPTKGSRKRSFTSVENLFDPMSRGMNPRIWLHQLSSEEFVAVGRGLRLLLQLGDEEEIVRAKGSGIEIEDGRGRVELGELSDGYKAMAGLALDLMQLFLLRWGSVEAAEGIVLIDELGAHLHPRWQMRVTESLRATFPRVQFIATTHDPLCLRGLRNGEVVALRRRGPHIYALHDELPPIEGMTVDQLLTNEHFGLSTSLDPAIEELFDRYYELLAKRRRSAKEQDELAGLAGRLEAIDLLGRTRRERLALEAVDESLAAERRVTSGGELARLSEDTKRQIRSAWKKASGQ
jgi:uncharacterized protein (TIGR02646 family)